MTVVVCVVVMDPNPEVEREVTTNFKSSLKCIAKVVFVKYDRANVSTFSRLKPKGIILSGSTARILDPNNVITIDPKVLDMGIPILGICFGYQTMVKLLSGPQNLRSGTKLILEPFVTDITTPFNLPGGVYLLNHYDRVVKAPKNWTVAKRTRSEVIYCHNNITKMMGMIFHPEKHTATGRLFFTEWLKWISS